MLMFAGGLVLVLSAVALSGRGVTADTEPPRKDVPKTKASPEKNPLAGCLQCHVNVEKKFVKSLHFKKKISCTDCHGPSQGHVADENNDVKPDQVFARKDVDRLCSKCHDCGRTITAAEKALPADKRQVCSQCHRAHAFSVPKDKPGGTKP
jgi:formate-dependent nitrite reductase cytochrome c552 subunit